MSKGKKKVIEVDDDELDFLPSLLTDPAFDPAGAKSIDCYQGWRTKSGARDRGAERDPGN